MPPLLMVPGRARRSAPMIRSTLAALAFALLVLAPCLADPADIANGWRGNGTGLWPDAHPPLEWHRLPRGVVADLRTRADRPGAKAEADAPRLENGLVPEWLVLGPFPVADSVQDFNKAQLTDEPTVQPADGDKGGARAWHKLSAPLDDPWAF